VKAREVAAAAAGRKGLVRERERARLRTVEEEEEQEQEEGLIKDLASQLAIAWHGSPSLSRWQRVPSAEARKGSAETDKERCRRGLRESVEVGGEWQAWRGWSRPR
jgi:hypothetical protein